MCQSWVFGLIWPLNRLPYSKLPFQKRALRPNFTRSCNMEFVKAAFVCGCKERNKFLSTWRFDPNVNNRIT